jgi:hypothetical protein
MDQGHSPEAFLMEDPSQGEVYVNLGRLGRASWSHIVLALAMWCGCHACVLRTRETRRGLAGVWPRPTSYPHSNMNSLTSSATRDLVPDLRLRPSRSQCAHTSTLARGSPNIPCHRLSVMTRQKTCRILRNFQTAGILPDMVLARH